MKRSSNPEEFLDASEQERVEEAVKQAEQSTSAEIKMLIVRHCWFKLEEKAGMIFLKNGWDKTKDRNCVMIMLVLANREFLIYGDEGIHKHVGQGFWDETRNIMLEHFKKDEFGTGLVNGIESIGQKLKEFFPYTEEDENEVSDEITYED